MICICESCEYGYHKDFPACPWCGAPGFLAAAYKPVVSVLDTECYPDYWLCKISPAPDGESGEYQCFPGHPLEIDALKRHLSKVTVYTFNGQHYDMPMLTLALSGATPAQLKEANDAIIVGGLKHWEFYREYNLLEPKWIDHVDLIDVKPGQDSLKLLGGKMHSKKIQDLPISPSQSIRWWERAQLREYCGNDLVTTEDLRKMFVAQVKLRYEMSEEYGLDLRSKSDPQIAEAIMKKLIGGKVDRLTVAPGTVFHHKPQDWIQYRTPALNYVLDLIKRSPFKVTNKGGVEMTDELSNYHIIIGRTKYHMGIGGLHSTEKSICHLADAEYSLQDIDVASYYPNLIKRTGINPSELYPESRKIYLGWITRRLEAKHAGLKKTADSLKTLLNGTFGKLGSMWSIFYGPENFLMVTLTGQLALLMLIEMLEEAGIQVVSANTDGIVVRCRRDMEWLRDNIVAWWCGLTEFETEAADYRAICMRDISSYIAIKTDGTVKLKGDGYARPVPVATSWPAPSGEVCIDAMVDYLTKGVPIAQTIRACADVRKFVHVRRVQGGGQWNGEVLGKAVRWYYSNALDASIVSYVKNGNKVPDTDGCRPMMELPDDFAVPGDLDYDRYIADARGRLTNLGVQQ